MPVKTNDLYIRSIAGLGWVNLSDEARKESRMLEQRRRAAIIRCDLPQVYPVIERHIYRACAWCGRYRYSDGIYRRTSPRDLNQKIDTSHGICPECQAVVRKEFINN
jgi:hypothetical protein